MLEPGRLLELLYGAHRALGAITMEVQDWSRREPSNVLILQTGGQNAVRAHWLDGGPNATPVISSRRIWFEPPARLRVEILQGREVLRAAVRDGNTWWRWDRQDGETAGDLSSGAELPPLLDSLQLNPARLLSAMWLEVTGSSERNGRPVILARGTPRDPTTSATRQTDFAFDVEHGTPLYIAAYEGGDPASVAEVQALDYAAIDPGVFRFSVAGERAGRTQARTASSVPSTTNAGSWSSRRAVVRSVLTDYRTIWLTGLPGAGKTTIARATERLLRQIDIPCCVLDGDDLRQGLSSDLGLSRDDRGEQARRVAHVAAVVADAGIIPIVALVSPYAEDRARAREIHEEKGVRLLEIWVNTPIDVCAARDPKGLYAADAVSGEDKPDGSGLTGISAPYQEPANPDLMVHGDDAAPRVAAAQIVELLVSTVRTSRLLALQ